MTKPRHPRPVLVPLPGEEWMPVVGYEQTYAVSSLGRVWSNPRPRTAGGLKKQVFDKHGYPQVALVQDGVQRTARVHQLVAEAFIGPRPDGMEVLHIDGTRDPRATNLRYDTHRENIRDVTRHGLWPDRRQTHCKRGHEFTEANIVVTATGRACRQCRNAGDRRRRALKAGRA